MHTQSVSFIFVLVLDDPQ